METGYGVAKVGSDAEQAKRSALALAMEDLLSPGPGAMLSSSQTVQSAFRMHAPQLIQPEFMETGVRSGYRWVVVGAPPEVLERAWTEFLAENLELDRQSLEAEKQIAEQPPIVEDRQQIKRAETAYIVASIIEAVSEIIAAEIRHKRERDHRRYTPVRNDQGPRPRKTP